MKINLIHLSLQKIEDLLALAKATNSQSQSSDDEAKRTLDENVEAAIESYLLNCNDEKVALTQYLVSLTQQEITELLAVYYYFSKLTYDTTITTPKDLAEFWLVCCTNAEIDIARIGLETMLEFLKERHNLAIILSNAVINLR